MLITVIKSVITFIAVLFIVRLMGKRQLGEMQPFELVITLIIADLVCIPMNDPSIPLYSGLVPVATLCVMHWVFSTLARKSLFMRGVLGGNPAIVISPNGIEYGALKKLNMNIDDLVEAAHTAGFFYMEQIKYGIVETNGKLSVVPDLNFKGSDLYPLPLINDGKFVEKSMKTAALTESEVHAALKRSGFKAKDVLLMDLKQDGQAYIQPKYGKFVVAGTGLGKGGW